jgi:hypothetical protein
LDGAFEDIWSGGAKLLLDGKTTKEGYIWIKEMHEYWVNYREMRIIGQKTTMLAALRQDTGH